jgi:hypothetical protein
LRDEPERLRDELDRLRDELLRDGLERFRDEVDRLLDERELLRDRELRERFGAGGTLSPSSRASESPMAMACRGFVTFLPERPECSLPRFISRMTFSTFLPAFGPYFLAISLPLQEAGC